MTQSVTTLDPTADDLILTLGAIATPAEIAMVEAYLELAIEMPQGNEQIKARERTRRYKLRTALRREPSSQHILQACAYVVFTRGEAEALPIIEETLNLLHSAGFSRKQTGKAMKRFATGAAERKRTWIGRTKVSLWKAIVTAIKATVRNPHVTK